VVGIVHTNYLEYAKREENGSKKEMFMRVLNQVSGHGP
jgi:digalactosyldiacylglycerol synthase